MHVFTTDFKPEFPAFDLTLRIETLEQAQILYSIFACPPIANSAVCIDSSKIRRCLENRVGNLTVQELHNSFVSSVRKKIINDTPLGI